MNQYIHQIRISRIVRHVVGYDILHPSHIVVLNYADQPAQIIDCPKLWIYLGEIADIISVIRIRPGPQNR